MYEKLIESSRACAMRYNGNCDRCLFCGMSNDENGDCYQQLHKAAADAIEELQKACEEAYSKGLLEGGIAQRAEDEKVDAERWSIARTAEGGNMIEEIGTMALWGIITLLMIVYGSVSLEYAYIGMCIMLAAGLLHKEE